VNAGLNPCRTHDAKTYRHADPFFIRFTGRAGTTVHHGRKVETLDGWLVNGPVSAVVNNTIAPRLFPSLCVISDGVVRGLAKQCLLDGGEQGIDFLSWRACSESQVNAHRVSVDIYEVPVHGIGIRRHREFALRGKWNRTWLDACHGRCSAPGTGWAIGNRDFVPLHSGDRGGYLRSVGGAGIGHHPVANDNLIVSQDPQFH
jgi:hypothetical protein